MKLNKQATTHQVTQILPVSTHSIIRLSNSPESFFPAGQRIGRTNYFEVKSIYDWLNTRASNAGAVQSGDKILDIGGVCELLGRSKAWIWSNITKNAEITKIDLSPDGTSKNPRRYFIERELKAAFPELVGLVEQEAA